jgi:hypothetical protein
MSPMHRRTLLATFGAAASGSVAGCSAVGTDDPPAGSLQFRNEDALPHTIRLSVTDVGSEPGDEPGSTAGDVTVPAPQRNLTASTNLSPEDSTTYTGVFTESVWYGIECTVDGRRTSDREVTTRVTYHPAPPGREYVTFLRALLRDSGRVELVVVTTENTGQYTPDVSG